MRHQDELALLVQGVDVSNVVPIPVTIRNDVPRGYGLERSFPQKAGFEFDSPAVGLHVPFKTPLLVFHGKNVPNDR
jgi:hypothetical protein